MRLPRPSIRLRLTAWYATIFLAMGIVLLAVSYGVVRHEFRDEQGKFLWPGYSENSRVLEWICRRHEGEAGAEDTPIGAVPRPPAHIHDDLGARARFRQPRAGERIDAR